jgi:hypothetical protein
MIAEKLTGKEIVSRTPSFECLGENERDQDNRHGGELDLLGFNCRVANRPHSPYDQPMVLWSNIGIGRYWFGVLPLYVGYFFETGNSKKPGAPPSWDFPRIWLFEAREIYKWRWERRLQIGQREFTPTGCKIKTFFWGEGRLVRGRTSCAGEEEQERKDYRKRFFRSPREGAPQNYVPSFGGIPAPPRYYGGVPMQAWGMVQPCPH